MRDRRAARGVGVAAALAAGSVGGTCPSVTGCASPVVAVGVVAWLRERLIVPSWGFRSAA